MTRKDDAKPQAAASEATPTGAATLRDWLKSRRMEEVECAVADIAGVARGKAMPASKFADLKPTFLPVSIFFQDITGAYVDFEGDQDYTEGDLLMVPDLTTIRVAPWANRDRCVAWVLEAERAPVTVVATAHSASPLRQGGTRHTGTSCSTATGGREPARSTSCV